MTEDLSRHPRSGQPKDHRSDELHRTFSRRRITWREPLLCFAVPIFVFIILELILWGAGVAPDRRTEDPFVGFVSGVPLFVEETGTHGAPYLVTAGNKRGFFNVQRFPLRKPPGTFRIFCLGGSTTYGRPYTDSTSFPGWLRALLPAADPSRSWEVINAGGISYASYRVARLMEELVRYQPDLFILYTGHNEFLEERTYAGLRNTPELIKQAAEIMSRTRVWIAYRRVLRQVVPASTGVSQEKTVLPDQVEAKLDHSAGLELYERDDELRDRVLEHYELSLERAIGLAKAAGAKVLLVAPASNLRDFSPFKSQHTDGIGDTERALTLEHLDIARRLLAEQSWEGARDRLELALQSNPRYAEAHYLLGHALLGSGQIEAAEASFLLARDEDVCPLRALSPVRQIVLELAEDQNVLALDYTGRLAERLDRKLGLSIPGAETFLDHVHPTIRENRDLALMLLEELIAQGIVTPSPRWGEDTIAEVTHRVESSVDQALHARALANLSLTLNWAGKNEDSRRLAFQALDLGVEDPTILMMVARHHAIEGDTDRALQFLQRAIRANPQSPVAHLQIGLLFAGRGDLEAAAGHFFLSTLIWPENDKAHQQLGFVMARKGRYKMALESYRNAQRLNPANASLESRIAQIQARLGDDNIELPLVELSVTRHPSGAASVIAQTRPDASGTFVPDGLWTEWSETGQLLRYVDFEQGRAIGHERRWPRTD